MPSTADWPIEWTRGSDWNRRLELTAEDKPWKLMGHDVVMKVYDRKGGTLTTTLSNSNGRVVVDEDGGRTSRWGICTSYYSDEVFEGEGLRWYDSCGTSLCS